MRFREVLAGKPHNKRYYELIDDPETLRFDNAELMRIAAERTRARKALLSFNEEVTIDKAPFSEEAKQFIGAGTKVVGGGGIFVPRDGTMPAIHVDCGYTLADTRNPAIYREYLGEAHRRMTINRGHANQRMFPRAVYQTVMNRIKVTTNRVVTEEVADVVDLSLIMEKGEGEPLHRVMACAALLDVQTPGLSVSVESGVRVSKQNSNEEKIHTWVCFNDRGGVDWILDPDPDKSYFGTRQDSIEKGPWEYARAGEKEHYRQIRDNPSSTQLAILSMQDYRDKKEGQ